MELAATFMDLLEGFRSVFTSPSFVTFQLLMTGWILSFRHRYVTDLIVSSDSVLNGHFSDYHRFFSQAKWSIDRLWEHLARMLVDHFVGPDGVILLAGDDTLCRKRGLGLFGAGMHHDPLISSKAKKLVNWGHDWVNFCLIVANPWWAPTKMFALPICMRLYRNKQGVTKGKKTQSKGGSKKKAPPSTKRRKKQAKREQRKKRKLAARRKRTRNQKNPSGSVHVTRPELMREMLELVASWFPDRQFLFVADSLYTGESVLPYLPQNIHLIGAVHPRGALYEPAPEKQDARGRKRKKGQRLPTRDEWAASRTPWTTLTFKQYGLHGTLETKTRTGLYDKAGKDRLLRFVLTRHVDGQRPTRIFYCTNLQMDPRQILATYANRWSIEVTHHDAKQLLGLEDPANRVPLAVERTAPMSMFLYRLTVLWYADHGHANLQFPLRPWYPRKSEPRFADMLTTLRRVTWEEQLSPVRPANAVCEKCLRLLTYLATLAG